MPTNANSIQVLNPCISNLFGLNRPGLLAIVYHIQTIVTALCKIFGVYEICMREMIGMIVVMTQDLVMDRMNRLIKLITVAKNSARLVGKSYSWWYPG